MLNRIKSWFENGDLNEASSGNDHDRLQIAAAALLVEAATLDEVYGPAERQVIARLLQDRFSMSAEEADSLLEAAEKAQGASIELYSFTRDVKDGFTHEERVNMIEMLWEVVYADGVRHEYEDHLLRRVAGLLHVSDRERAEARHRVLDRLGVSE